MKYDIIYADPPWKYNSRENHKTRFRGGADGHYRLLSLQDIWKLDVESICSDNAIMFLWCTFPFLKEQLKTFEAWGFKYKTVGFTWIKTNIKNGKPFFGVGYYSKSNAEVCMLGTRGKVLKPRNMTVSSVVIEPRTKHSSKPAVVRDLISKMYPDLSKIELFARPPLMDGWRMLGDEIDGKNIRDALNEVANE